MPSFAYQARNKGGQAVSGTQDAPDQRSALESLRAAGLYVTKIDATRSRSKVAPRTQALENGGGVVAAPAVPMTTSAAPMTASAAPMASAQAVAMPGPSPFPPPGAPSPLSPPPVAAPSPVPLGKPHTAIPPAPTKFTGRANAKEMSLYFRQMGSMISAGTALSHGLNTLGQHSANRALREASREMSLRVAQGMPWSETMKSYPGLFSELMIGLIAAGEAGGFLDRICIRLSEYAERDYHIQQTIKRETWYPKLLVFCSFLIPSAVPLVLTSMGVMPGNPLLNWFRSIIGPLCLVLGAWAAWKIFNYVAPVTARRGVFRQTIDSLKLMIPIVGKTVRGLSVAKFCRALSAMYMAGAAPHRGVEVAANACGNAAVGEAARRAIPRLQAGETMTNVLRSTGHFQPIVLQMLQSGEETGSIDTQLDKVADFLEQDAETTIKQSVKVVGVLALLLVAAYIGLQVAQFWLGYYTNLLDGNF